MEYHAGKDNTVAEAMSRWAYPASSNREDVSIHGSAIADHEVSEMVEKERQEAIRAEEGKSKPKKANPIKPVPTTGSPVNTAPM